MEKQPTKKGTALLFIGMTSLILSMTIFKENNTPKMVILGISIVSFLASIYFNIKTVKKNIDNSKKKE